MVEGDWKDDLIVGQVVHCKLFVVSSHIFVSVGEVTARCFPRVEEFLWTMLQQFAEGQIPVQGRLDSWHSQWLDLMHFTVRKCVQNW